MTTANPYALTATGWASLIGYVVVALAAVATFVWMLAVTVNTVISMGK